MLATVITVLLVAAAPAVAGPAHGAAQVTLHPSSGPVGTRVSFAGDIDPSAVPQVRNPSYFTLIRELDRCELLVALSDRNVRVDDSGHVSGSFVVGREGDCFQQAVTQPAAPGSYTLALGCHACFVGTFEITRASTLPRTGDGSTPIAIAVVGLIGCGGLLMLATRRPWLRMGVRLRR
ncbi:MAG: hypothetical protein JWN29_3623 [Acidimicrobiales bacterium]|nr:hypothetical protein [Acidimicrobiales bacterium]